MPSAAIIIPISCNDDKSKNESIGTMSDGRSFKPRGHRFCFVRDIFMPLFSPCCLASPQGWISGVFLLTVGLRPDVTFSKSTPAIACVHLVKRVIRIFEKEKPFKKQSYFCFLFSNNSEHISTATCPGRCSLERPTGARINTRRTWRPPQRAATHRSV